MIKNKACIILEAKYNKTVAAGGIHKNIMPKNNMTPKNGTTTKLAAMLTGDMISKWNATIGHVPKNTAADENKILFMYKDIFSIIYLNLSVDNFLRAVENTDSSFGVKQAIKNTQEKES